MHIYHRPNLWLPMLTRSLIMLTFSLVPIGAVYALEMDFRGQLTGLVRTAKIEGQWENLAGVLYIPELSLTHGLDEGAMLDTEFALNGLAAIGSGPFESETELDVYRANLRYTTTQSEIRLGLQKINFGPARLLRPLRWFDQLNPTDPLQFTEGVYALRYRYDTLNQTGIWLWTLVGNDDPKGYESLPTPSNSMEAGGRLQAAWLNGEWGATWHTRKVEASAMQAPDFRENRYALDGRWDVGVGLWFESVCQQQRSAHVRYEWSQRHTVGLDYTFDVGNGIYFLIEHMGIARSENTFGWGDDYHISAYSIQYSWGILDSLTAVGTYLWDEQDFLQHLNWKRTYDNVVISCSLFYYPQTEGFSAGPARSNATTGHGGEIMIIFNH